MVIYPPNCSKEVAKLFSQSDPIGQYSSNVVQIPKNHRIEVLITSTSAFESQLHMWDESLFNLSHDSLHEHPVRTTQMLHPNFPTRADQRLQVRLAESADGRKNASLKVATNSLCDAY